MTYNRCNHSTNTPLVNTTSGCALPPTIQDWYAHNPMFLSEARMQPDNASDQSNSQQTDNTRRAAIRACTTALIAASIPLVGCAATKASKATASKATSTRRSTSELLARWGDNGTETRVPAKTPQPVARKPKLGSPSNYAAITPPDNLQRRADWARGNPNFSNMDKMRGVKRITIHHDGMSAFTNTSRNAARTRIEQIRSAHRNGNGWADIGYHYAIDPAGRVWEGRPTDWQGAHVKFHNEHNLGILVMGNYEHQRPNEIQLAALKQLLQSRCRAYNIQPSRIYTHRELRPTACPGRYLQPRIVAIRSTLA